MPYLLRRRGVEAKVTVASAGLSIVQAKADQGTGNRTVVLDAAPTPGNTLWAVATYASNNATNITGLSGTGWTQVDAGSHASVGGPSWKLYSKTVAAGDSATINLTVSAGAGATLQVVEVQNSSGFDEKSSNTNTSGLLVSTTTAATTTPNDLAVSFLVTNSAFGTLTVNNSFTTVGTNTSRTAIANLPIAASGTAVTSSFSYTNSVNAAEVLVVLKP